MRRIQPGLFSSILILIGLVFLGCSTSNDSNSNPDVQQQKNSTEDDNSVSKLKGPARALYVFLDAVRKGNDERATKMLSAVAREKTAALNVPITPQASDTARFSIGKVNYVAEDGAQVASVWTDVDEDGKSHSDEAVWVLRLEQNGWRIAGVATVIFPGEPPLQLNFEDPEDLVKQCQWAHEEINRRFAKENFQAKESNNSDKIQRR